MGAFKKIEMKIDELQNDNKTSYSWMEKNAIFNLYAEHGEEFDHKDVIFLAKQLAEELRREEEIKEAQRAEDEAEEKMWGKVDWKIYTDR